MTNPGKILIIRLSSIGDIVLTTPAVRALRKRFPNVEIHYLLKEEFAPLLAQHPAIDQLHLFKGDITQCIADLRKENFDFIVDLHGSIRSGRIRRALRKPASVIRKQGLRMRLYARFRIGKLTGKHVVERYMDVIRPLGCEPDDRGLDFFIPGDAVKTAQEKIAGTFSERPLAICLGAGYATKKWIPAHYVELLNLVGKPVILLGGKGEQQEAGWIGERLKIPFLDLTGKVNLTESAAMVKTSFAAITHDSGFMHIAAALGTPLVSIWGHSVPAFGFSPYKANAEIVENNNLSCRPCTKLGYDKCPKGHFRCMKDITPEQVNNALIRITKK